MKQPQYLGLHVWLQRVDDYGMDQGDALETLNHPLIHAQVGDLITNPRFVSQDPDAHLKGEWTVDARKWSEHKGSPEVPRNFTVYIRQQ
jgi:hypothetical protein